MDSGLPKSTQPHVKARARVPIIFLTAVPIGNADVVSGYARGAVDFLLKPFDPEILRSKVSVFVDLYQKEQMIKRQAGPLRQRDREAFERRSELRFRSLMDVTASNAYGLCRPDLHLLSTGTSRSRLHRGFRFVAVCADRMFEIRASRRSRHDQIGMGSLPRRRRPAESAGPPQRHTDRVYRWSS